MPKALLGEKVVRGLSEKCFIVTGAGSGIGQGCTLRLLEEGARVVAADINAAGLARTVASSGAAKGLIPIEFDLAEEASITSLVANAAASLGRLDGLVNVAADVRMETVHGDVAIGEFSAEHWTRVFRVNVIGTGLMIRESLPHLLKQGAGSVVNISSAAAWMAEDVRPAYAASKIALHALTRHTAKAYGRKGLRCNAIAPGMVLTEAARTIMSQEFRQTMIGQICLPRLGETDDIAASVAFLLSEESTWITGQIYSVDGGQILRE